MKWLLYGLACLYSIPQVSSHTLEVENFQVKYEKSFNLTCESSHYNVSNLPTLDMPKAYMWILPNGEFIQTHKWEDMKQSERVNVLGDGKILNIKHTDDEDYGIYNCLVQTIGNTFKLVARKGINVDGPYYGDMLEKYRTNIIIGVCAGGGLLVLCIIGCLVYHLRYRNDEEEEDEEKLNGTITAHDNGGFDKADTPSSSEDVNYADSAIEDVEKRPVSDIIEVDTKL